MPPAEARRPPDSQRGGAAADADWTWRAELADLLRACRARLGRPAVPGSRGGGLRQEDVADLAGLSLRRYAAFERGEFTPPVGMVDQVAAALRMSDAERSALHVLATAQDPPSPVTRSAQDPPREPSKALRDLVSHMGDYPAALTDETWRLLHYNPAMNAWAGGWYDTADPGERNLVSYLFSRSAESFLPDLHAVRRASLAVLRYQYTRNLTAPGFTHLVDRLTAGSPEAAALWARHEVAFPPHESQVRVRHPDLGIIHGHVLFVPVSPRLWTYTMVLPPGVKPPDCSAATHRLDADPLPAADEHKDSRGVMVDLNPEAAGTIAVVPPPGFPASLAGGGFPAATLWRAVGRRCGSGISGSGRAVITMVKERTQVGIVGAGPAGLLLSHLLALGGIESRVVEARSRAHCETRQRAGMLEPATVKLLRDAGLGRRLDAEGMQHDGIYLQFAGERHHVNFREMTGRCVTVYPQTEIVKDLIQARTANGGAPEFETADTEVGALDSDRPVLRYTDSAGQRHEVACDAIAGCDGFRGVCRPAIPAGGLRTIALRTYPFGWLGILAQAPPSTDQVIYCRHDRGFALHSMRTPEIGRLYLQVPAGEGISRWPDDRIWSELSLRLGIPGWQLRAGPVLGKSITGMRSFVAAPMRYRRLFLAGDAAHIVPPTGAKGLNLAVADVAVLATALIGLLRYGRQDLADAYSDTREERVWRATYLSWWMTTMLHVHPRQDPFDSALQIAQLRNLTSSRAAAGMLAEIYTGGAPALFDPSPSPSAGSAALLAAAAQAPVRR